jgi:hypothetical protein
MIKMKGHLSPIAGGAVPQIRYSPGLPIHKACPLF